MNKIVYRIVKNHDSPTLACSKTCTFVHMERERERGRERERIWEGDEIRQVKIRNIYKRNSGCECVFITESGIEKAADVFRGSTPARSQIKYVF